MWPRACPGPRVISTSGTNSTDHWPSSSATTLSFLAGRRLLWVMGGDQRPRRHHPRLGASWPRNQDAAASLAYRVPRIPPGTWRRAIRAPPMRSAAQAWRSMGPKEAAWRFLSAVGELVTSETNKDDAERLLTAAQDAWQNAELASGPPAGLKVLGRRGGSIRLGQSPGRGRRTVPCRGRRRPSGGRRKRSRRSGHHRDRAANGPRARDRCLSCQALSCGSPLRFCDRGTV